MSQPSNIRPLGNGHFSYTRAVGPDELSPRSSSSSSADSEAVSSESDSPPVSPAPAHRQAPAPPFIHQIRATRVVTEASFVLEELSDSDDSDDARLDVIRPYKIEDAESERSRSRSRNPPEVVDRSVISDLKNLNCSDSDSSESDLDDFQEMLRRTRLEKRHRRMTSGSIGKRTISESIGSDSDREDLKLDANEVGSSARRLRRRLGDRRSLLFQDPPPRIDELEEHIDEWDTEALARELPYYTLEYISMEVDSP